MDELNTYVKQQALLDAAREAVNRRLKLDARGTLNVAFGIRWRYVRWPWRDRAEELYVKWIEAGYTLDCAAVSEEDPDYAVVTNNGSYGSTHYHVFEKALHEPDDVKDCRYLVSFWEKDACVWAAPFFTFREAEDFAIDEASKYCIAHNIERREEPFRTETTSEYINDQVLDRYWSNEDHAEIRVTPVEYGTEPYPYEYEQEVA